MPTITQHGELQGTEPSAAAPHADAVAGCQPTARAWPRDPSAEGLGRGSGQGVAEHSRHCREAFSAGSSSLRLVLERAHLFLVNISPCSCSWVAFMRTPVNRLGSATQKPPLTFLAFTVSLCRFAVEG